MTERDVVKTSSSWISRLLNRHFSLIAALLLIVMSGAQIGSAVVESPTNDEPNHLTAGYVYLTTGSYAMDRSHPPLARVVAALPLLLLPLERISAERAWLDLRKFIWKNQVSADTIFLYPRLVIITMTILLGAWLSWWTRRRFGAPIALVALTFYAFDPNIIAHGHYVTTDLFVSLCIFLTCTLWVDFLEAPTWKTLLLTALSLGCTLTSKFSGLFVVLVLAVLYAIAWRRKRGRPFFTWSGAVKTFAVITGGACFVVAVSYGPEIRPFLHVLRRELRNGQILSADKRDGALLAFGYLEGLHELAQHDANGHEAYLLGHFSMHGWWEYFPIAFLVKTPTAVLVACGLAALSLLCFRRRPPRDLALWCLALTALFYFALAVRSSIDIGIRHLLPIYPFLYVLLAVALIRYTRPLLRKAFPSTMAALLVLVGVESLANYPHYLAFFNWPSGGSANGSRYLLDSNIDWGQDSKNLAHFVRDHHLTPLCTALFGPAPPDYYNPGSRDLLHSGVVDDVEHVSCVVAVSVNFLRGLNVPPALFASLRQRRPLAQVGHSIYLYDLRH